MCQKNIWTIGHSTHLLSEFIELLKSFEIEMVVDIRSFPSSKKIPHFNKNALMISLSNQNIGYIHLKELGGRRKPNLNSHNTNWRVPAFRGYADYSETHAFDKAIMQLINIAQEKRVVYMCAEAVWWRCHRSIVSDYLIFKSWNVTHIMGLGKGVEHAFTSPARSINGKLVYNEE